MKLKYKFVVQEVSDGFVAVAVDEDAEKFSGIVRMNRVGKEIFAMMEQETTEEDIIAALQSQYIDTESAIPQEVHRFIEKLTQEKIITGAGGESV